MPTEGPSLLLVTLLAINVTICTAEMCIVNPSILQAMAEKGDPLFPCVIANYSRTKDTCLISDYLKGYAITSMPRCHFGSDSAVCYCSEECSLTVLKLLLKIHSAKASKWEKNCGAEFLKFAQSTPKSIKPTTASVAVRTTAESQNVTQDEEQDYLAAKKRLIKAASFKMFWIFCGMAFVMVCQLVLITMIRNESERYRRQLRATSSRSSHLEAQRTSSSSSAPGTPRSKRRTFSSKRAIVRGRVSHKNMPSGDWYQFKKP